MLGKNVCVCKFKETNQKLQNLCISFCDVNVVYLCFQMPVTLTEKGLWAMSSWLTTKVIAIV